MTMAANSSGYSEKSALSMGVTPLMRRKELPQAGLEVRILKAGFEEWKGMVSPASPDINAKLVPVSASKNEKTGLPANQKITAVIPVRLSLTGIDGADLPTQTQADFFKETALGGISTSLDEKFSHPIAIEKIEDPIQSEIAWMKLEKSLENVNFDKLPHYSVKPKVEIEDGISKLLKDKSGKVLLLRVEAYYLDKGQRIKKAALPILASIVSGVAAQSSASANNSGSYTYSVFGPPPQKELLVAQMFMIDAGSHELLWVGEASVPENFETQGVILQVTEKLVSRIPANL